MFASPANHTVWFRHEITVSIKISTLHIFVSACNVVVLVSRNINKNLIENSLTRALLPDCTQLLSGASMTLRHPVSANARCYSSRGLTLVEIIIAIAVLAILSAIALPAFRSFTSSSQATSAANDFVSALNLARSEAVTRSITVSVCKSADQTSCTTEGDWHQGWIVFIDADNDGSVDTGEEILRVYSAPGGDITISGDDSIDRMTYAASGFFAADYTDTITVEADTRRIDIVTAATGRVHTE